MALTPPAPNVTAEQAVSHHPSFDRKIPPKNKWSRPQHVLDQAQEMVDYNERLNK
jgi:hypothetical protein